TCHAIGLRHAVDDDSAFAHAVKTSHRDVFGAIVENVFVDFVRDAVSVPLDAKVSNEFELFASEDFAGGIIWRVEDDGFRVRAEGSGEFAEIESPLGIFIYRRLHFDETW